MPEWEVGLDGTVYEPFRAVKNRLQIFSSKVIPLKRKGLYEPVRGLFLYL